jgi:hypothetical protein
MAQYRQQFPQGVQGTLPRGGTAGTRAPLRSRQKGDSDVNKFTPEELKQFPEWLRDIMRTTPEYPRAIRKGEEFDPGAVPVLQGPQGRYYDPSYSRLDEREMAAKGKTAVDGNTDTVPAMLTPREAVLNRNAAELAGRGAIEHLNQEGNKLAEKGVDLASRGKNMKQKKYQGGAATVDPLQMYRNGMAVAPNAQSNPYPDNRGPVPGPQPDRGPMPPGGIPGPQPDRGLGNPYLDNRGPVPEPRGVPLYPSGRPGDLRGMTGAPGYFQPPWDARSTSFYPKQPPPLRAQEGSPEVQPIGYVDEKDPYWKQVQLSAPNIDLDALKKAAAKQGLTSEQVAGIAKMFQGTGGGGGGAGSYYDTSGGAMAGALGQLGGYQGGISDIGYPPFIAPQAEYHADKGSNWVGPYDQDYMIPRYWRGTANVGW